MLSRLPVVGLRYCAARVTVRSASGYVACFDSPVLTFGHGMDDREVALGVWEHGHRMSASPTWRCDCESRWLAHWTTVWWLSPTGPLIVQRVPAGELAVSSGGSSRSE